MNDPDWFENKPEKVIKKALMMILLKGKIFYFTVLINSKK